MADELKEVDQHEAAERDHRPGHIMDEECRIISDLISNLYIPLILYL